MKKKAGVFGIGLLICFSLIVLTGCQPGQAEDIQISGVWARPSPMQEGNGAVYMVIANEGVEDERLIGVTGDIAAHIELHLSSMENDVMMMQQVDWIDVPAGESVELKPGDYHIMLISLNSKLTAGELFQITLIFESGREILIDVAVRE